jgi:hypothetical protein
MGQRGETTTGPSFAKLAKLNRNAFPPTPNRHPLPHESLFLAVVGAVIQKLGGMFESHADCLI